VRRRFTALTLLGALALLAAGCGSSSSSSTSSSATTPSATSTQGGSASTPTQATTTSPSSTQQSTQGSSTESSSSSETPENSIKDYGTAASSVLKGTLAATAFSFFKAMAASDYAKICAGLSASNRAQLEAFDKAKHEKLACPALLKMLIGTRGAPEARKAAAGALTSVRVKGSTAFVIFKPKGGAPSYFVLKREGSAWKAISLAPGSPLNPTAG
jgi:hypothetical protein